MATNYYQIPVTTGPDQTFKCTIPVDGKNLTLNFRLRFNAQGNYWWMTISDKDNNLLIDALPLLTPANPTGNILDQYQYLKIGSCYLVNNGNTTMDSPDSTNLGTDFLIVWGNTAG